MIFNSFTVAHDYNFSAQLPNGRRVFLSTNKTFEVICSFRQKELKFS